MNQVDLAPSTCFAETAKSSVFVSMKTHVKMKLNCSLYLLNFEDGVEDGQDGHLGDADERVVVGGGPLSTGKPVTGERHLDEKENHFFCHFISLLVACTINLF
jgi:hypothetical protein